MGAHRGPWPGQRASRSDARRHTSARITISVVAGPIAFVGAGRIIYRRLAAAGIARRPARPALRRQDLIAGLERGWSAPEIAAARAVSVSCVCRALDRENLLTAAQALKQQMRLRHPEYYASPVPSPTNVVLLQHCVRIVRVPIGRSGVVGARTPAGPRSGSGGQPRTSPSRGTLENIRTRGWRF